MCWRRYRKEKIMDNIDLLILLGIFGIVTYVLCQYFYNKGFDEGSKYTSRVIGVSSVKKNKKNVWRI